MTDREKLIVETATRLFSVLHSQAAHKYHCIDVACNLAERAVQNAEQARKDQGIEIIREMKQVLSNICDKSERPHTSILAAMQKASDYLAEEGWK